jgi:hypothetical protein
LPDAFAVSSAGRVTTKLALDATQKSLYVYTVSVTDGTYTWSQSAGSSSEDDFGVAYSSSLRRVTVTYFNGAPSAGKSITAVYRYGTSGITGALSGGSQHWMAISIDGVAQTGRQRVLAVPFAMQAKDSETAKFLVPAPAVFLIPSILGGDDGGEQGLHYIPFPIQAPSIYKGATAFQFRGNYVMSKELRFFRSMRIRAFGGGNTPTEQAGVTVKLLRENPSTGESVVIGEFSKTGLFDGEFVVPLNHRPDWSENRYVLTVSVKTPADQSVGRVTQLKSIKIEGDE